jgi:hypothetical protein
MDSSQSLRRWSYKLKLCCALPVLPYTPEYLRVRLSRSSLSSRITLNKLLNLSLPQFACLSFGDTISIYLSIYLSIICPSIYLPPYLSLPIFYVLLEIKPRTNGSTISANSLSLSYTLTPNI